MSEHDRLKQENNLEHVIDSFNYIVENNCSFWFKGMPVKKAFVDNASSEWFATFKSQIFFYTPRKDFIVFLYGNALFIIHGFSRIKSSNWMHDIQWIM